MPFSFKTILVPVDFSINTEVAVNKALEVADKEGATIHLMHVLSDRVSRLSLQNNKKLSEPIAKTAEPTIDQMIKERHYTANKSTYYRLLLDAASFFYSAKHCKKSRKVEGGPGCDRQEIDTHLVPVFKYGYIK
jgi:nucleotide-binding universal stress UspA family protein